MLCVRKSIPSLLISSFGVRYDNVLTMSAPLYRTVQALIVLFIIAMLGILVIDQGLIYGESQITIGKNRAENGLSSLHSSFNILDNYTDTMTVYGYEIYSYISQATDATTYLSAYLVDYQDSVTSYDGYVSPFEAYFLDAYDDVKLYGGSYLLGFLWASYSLILVGSVFLAVGFFTQSMEISILTTNKIITALLFILIGVEMFVLVRFFF